MGGGDREVTDPGASDHTRGDTGESRRADKPLVELRVFLRDLITGAWVNSYDPVTWVGEHDKHMTTALQLFLDTFGGTITISGTPEVGRVTVYPTTGKDVAPIADFDWHTLRADGTSSL